MPAGSETSGGGSSAVPRSKRRATVLLMVNPNEGRGSSVESNSGVATLPAMMPPLSPQEVIRTMLQALRNGDSEPTACITMLHEAATALLHQATTHSSSAGAAGGSASPLAPRQEQQQNAADDDEGFHSLSSGDEFSDAEERQQQPRLGAAEMERDQKRRKGPARIQIVQRGPFQPTPSADPSLSRLASLAWSGAAAHCLSCADAPALRQAVSLAEHAFHARPCASSGSLLAWACTRYADACEDPALHVKLLENATSLLETVVREYCEVGSREWLHALELSAWCYALQGRPDAAITAGETVLSVSPRNPELCCLVALGYSGEGNLEEAEALLKWTMQTFPAHVLTKGLLALLWGQYGNAQMVSDESDQQKPATTVRALLVDMVTHIRQLDSYAHRSAGSANNNTDMAPSDNSKHRDATLKPAIIGHLQANWSSLAGVSKYVLHAYLFAADVCLRLGFIELADATATAALECVSNANGVNLTVPPTVAASVLAMQARVHYAHGKEEAAKQLLDQCLALQPSVPASALGGCALHLTSSDAEALSWLRYSVRCTPRDANTLRHAAVVHTKVGEYSGAVDMLLAAAEVSMQQPMYPVSSLSSWCFAY